MTWKHSMYRPQFHALEDRTLLSVTAFAVDNTVSSLTISGELIALGLHAPLMEQAPGSMTAAYEGTLTADFDTGAGTISFLGDSTSLLADISGTWMPMIGGGSMGNPGSDDAPYGSTFQLFGNNWSALRDLVSTMSTDSPLTLTQAGGGLYTFPSVQTSGVASGNLDYNTTQFGQGRTGFGGSQWMSQNQGADGSLQDNGDGTFTITCPVDQMISGTLAGGAITVNLHVAGTISGTGSPGMTASHGSPAVRYAAVASNSIAVHTTGRALSVDPGSIALRDQSAAFGAPLAVSQTQQISDSSSLAGNDAALVSVHAASSTVDAVFVDPLQTLNGPF
jgi:hypothetical protein